MADIVSREIRLKSHSIGMPEESDFELVEVAIPEPKTGEVLVRNIYMSVDPVMRFGMRNAELSKTLVGGCVGQIVKSNSDQFQIGDYVLGWLGWREFYVSSAKGITKMSPPLLRSNPF